MQRPREIRRPRDEKLTDRTRKQEANILAADAFRRIARRKDAEAVSGLGIPVETAMKAPRVGALCAGKLIGTFTYDGRR